MHLDAPVLESSVLLSNIFTEKYFLLYRFFRMLCTVYLLCGRCTKQSPRSAVLESATVGSGVGIAVFLHNFFFIITALFSNQWPVVLTERIV